MFGAIGLATLVFLAGGPSPGARIPLKNYAMTLVGSVPANGDDDGFADADETLDFSLTLINKTGAPLTNLVATLSSQNATIECINPYQVAMPSVAAGATFTTPPFRFKVAGSSLVNRTSVDQNLSATFDVAIRSDQFAFLQRPIRITIPLDLDASGGGGTTTWLEDFEVASGLGKFTLQTLDAGKSPPAGSSNGMRCQYNNPNAANTNSVNDCWLGFYGEPAAGVNDWHLHDGSASNGNLGRAYTGTKSLHWGVHLGTSPSRDTGRLNQLDAARSFVAINVPLAGMFPELSFAQQVSLVDNRGVPEVDDFETLDRGVVEVGVVPQAGGDPTVWKKIYPYVNEYDQQGTDDFTNCTFDPTDDGNNENSFFDPTDPARRFGPSSTCMPEWSFARSGDTDYHFTADPLKIGFALDGPGLTGSINVGTWVEPRFSLQEFAGRRILIRFLGTSIEIDGYFTQTWDAFFGGADRPEDDGWYIDNVRASPAASVPLTIVPDTKSITPIPCLACTAITAALTATPNTTATPGQAVLLDASGSTVDICKHQPLQYQFWIDRNQNGIAGDLGDIRLRDFTADPTLSVGFDTAQQVAVVAGCPFETTCRATATAAVTVNCPTGVARTPFAQTIRLDKLYRQGGDIVIRWPALQYVSVIRGCLYNRAGDQQVCLKDAGTFTGTPDRCVANHTDWTDVVVDNYTDGFYNDVYYLVEGDAAPADYGCPATPAGFTTNEPSEVPGRDASLEAGFNPCP